MIKFKTDKAHKIFEIMVDGEITDSDFAKVTKSMESLISEAGQIKVLEEIRSIGHMSPNTLWEGGKFDFNHIRDISHCAVVSDRGWVGPLAKAAGAMLPCQIKVFSSSEINDARHWLQNA